jgi:hypothetical protein
MLTRGCRHMAETGRGRRRTTVRCWRWRRSPLRRTSDLVEAWVLLAAWVIGLAGGAAAGVLTVVAADRSFDRHRAERREVTAVVVERAPKAVDDKGTDGSHGEWAVVRWTVPDGSVRTGREQVAPGTVAGSSVRVWIDRRGVLASRPSSEAEAWLEAAVLGGAASVTAGTVVWVCAHGTRELLDRRRMAQWAVEWERVAPRWGRRTG